MDGRMLPNTTAEEIDARAQQLPGVRLIDLPTIDSDIDEASGAITVATSLADCPFEIKRLYWIHGANAGEVRGQHAHRYLSQLLVAVAGAFEIAITGDGEPHSFHLDTPRRGLLLGPGYWRVIRAIPAGSVLLVAASTVYDEGDYIRDYEQFLRYRRSLAPGSDTADG